MQDQTNEQDFSCTKSHLSFGGSSDFSNYIHFVNLQWIDLI